MRFDLNERYLSDDEFVYLRHHYHCVTGRLAIDCAGDLPVYPETGREMDGKYCLCHRQSGAIIASDDFCLHLHVPVLADCYPAGQDERNAHPNHKFRSLLILSVLRQVQVQE